jgi:hypothetical protein
MAHEHKVEVFTAPGVTVEQWNINDSAIELLEHVSKLLVDAVSSFPGATKCITLDVKSLYIPADLKDSFAFKEFDQHVRGGLGQETKGIKIFIHLPGAPATCHFMDPAEFPALPSKEVNCKVKYSKTFYETITTDEFSIKRVSSATNGN